MTPGDLVWYRQTCSGGYGYAHRVPAVFVKATECRVTVEVLVRDGTRKRINVHPGNVIPRARGESIEWEVAWI